MEYLTKEGFNFAFHSFYAALIEAGLAAASAGQLSCHILAQFRHRTLLGHEANLVTFFLFAGKYCRHAAADIGDLLRQFPHLGRRKVICIDSIKVEQGDYVDLGRPVLDGLVIPIVVKTLLFG